MEWMDFPSRGGEGSVWGLAVWVSVTRQPARRIQVEMPSRGSIHACKAIWAASTNKTVRASIAISRCCAGTRCAGTRCVGDGIPHIHTRRGSAVRACNYTFVQPGRPCPWPFIDDSPPLPGFCNSGCLPCHLVRFWFTVSGNLRPFHLILFSFHDAKFPRRFQCFVRGPFFAPFFTESFFTTRAGTCQDGERPAPCLAQGGSWKGFPAGGPF